MKHANWATIPSVPVTEFGKRQVFYGDNAMVVIHTLQPEFPRNTHSHPHEQLLYIVSGDCVVTIGNETIEMHDGDIARVPPNVLHDLVVLGDRPVVNMDIFSPVREDYIID